MYKILVVNPGSTSTEINIFEDETEVKSAQMVHPVAELKGFKKVIEQFPYRNNIIKSKLLEWGVKKGDLSAVVGRSGPRAKESGIFEVNQLMFDVVKSEKVRVEHPAILGCMLAKEIADEYQIPAYVPYPPPIEWPRIASVSGIPLINRRPAYHRQNIEAVAILAASEMSIDIKNVRLVIAHLEGGMSIVAFEDGRVIDTTSAFDEGPFTMERSGSLPASQVVEMCFSGKYTREQVLKMIRGEGGMVAFLGINKVSEVENKIESGDKEAEFYLEAMCYQIAKDIGAMATVLQGKVDAIILTGKILDSTRAVNWIIERVESIAPVKTYPEQEAIVFAQAGLSVLRGDEKAKTYE
ncbi:MAG TPA: butyrate kinase [Dehalococcoidia bacterium]|nr:butyrate kinase [Dehalococcoidia bacterium]